jgi:hypothetical protein
VRLGEAFRIGARIFGSLWSDLGVSGERPVRRLIMRPLAAGGLLVLVVGLAAPAPAGSLMKEVDGVRVELASEPGAPATRQPTTYRVRLANADGTPLGGARVTLLGRMADGMSVVAPLQPTEEPGIYRGRVLFTMEGTWILTLRVATGNRRFQLPLTEQVRP